MVKFRIKALKAVQSTNDECLQAAQDRDPGGLWLTAEQQTKGKGRQGRVWNSAPGNLYASVLLIDPCDIAFAAQLSFVTALAVFETAERITGLSYPQLALKWPNDVLLNGAKFSGILLEAKTLEQGRNLALVIGIGMNVLNVPEGMPYAVTALSKYNSETNLLQVRDTLMASFYKYLIIWNGGRFSVDGPIKTQPHFSKIRELWLEKARGIGETVIIRLPDEEKSGIFEGIDQHGRLELRTQNGTLVPINAGDLFFGHMS